MPTPPVFDMVPPWLAHSAANSRTTFITLELYAKKHADRDKAIAQVHASGAYGMKEIGDHFGLHYSRVSRILAELRLAKEKASTPKLLQSRGTAQKRAAPQFERYM